jgi:predicted AlkP superfamily pyrophosphatase or phosphodiesterase
MQRQTSCQFLRLIFMSACLFVCGLMLPYSAYSIPSSGKHRPVQYQKPRLIVVLSFDQMRGDYIDRWKQFWGATGFNRLLKNGVHFTHCLSDHASNITAPGHAILMTGKYPHKTGIVSNDMYDRILGREQYCVEDTVHTTFGVKNPREWTSPVNLATLTLGDILKQSSPQSKVVGVSYKDRAAILMAGKNADAAFWFENEADGFTTSSYYGFRTLPMWLRLWKEKNNFRQYGKRVWQPLVSAERYAVQDSCAWETRFPMGSTAFPHIMPDTTSAKTKKEYDKAFSISPFVVEHQFHFASAVLREYRLGLDDITDILNLSISTTDYVGHAYGPDSREVFELYVQVDTMLGNFLKELDRRIGKDKYVVVVSSDHGVAPTPEFSLQYGDDAGRINEVEFIEKAEQYLQQMYPQSYSKKFIRSFVKPNLFLNDDAFTSRTIKQQAVDSLARYVRTIQGIGAVATFEQLQNNTCPQELSSQIFALMRKDFYAQRTGDILVYPRYKWIFGSITATHGAPHEYDRHIPLIFSFTKHRNAVNTRKVSASCIAPTLAKVLGLEMKDVDGFSLAEKIF